MFAFVLRIIFSLDLLEEEDRTILGEFDYQVRKYHKDNFVTLSTKIRKDQEARVEHFLKQLDNVVLVTKSRYEGLQDAESLLSCLQACGVDNWIGYDDAMSMYYADKEED